MAASDGSEFFELEIDPVRESFARPSNAESARDDEDELIWEAIARLPSQKRDKFAVLRRSPSERALMQGQQQLTEPIDVRKLDRAGRELVVKKALATNSQDNFKLLSAIKKRLDRVGVQVSNVEVRFDNLNIVANVQIGSRALPTLINAARDTIEDVFTSLRLYRPNRYPLTILNQVSGILKPGRMTLLLGPPGSGKSTLLKALAGKLDDNLKVTGGVTYNGQNLDKFYVQRTSAYISQTDNHIAELTVRETLDFAASWQGASEDFAGNMKHLVQLEKEKNIRPSPEIDAFMKASSVRGKKHNISTDYILKVLGLDVCADTAVGSDMLRGVSGGQKKRVTTGEMIVGPRKTLFMDEISTGLDSSTTYQIVKCIGNFVHLMEGTVLMALLQPPPETFDLFDDLILLSEGYVVYEGPRSEVVRFFESLGFQLPPRKGVADFLQEVTSKKDQAQYWADPSKPYVFISAQEIASAFTDSAFGKSLSSAVGVPYDKAKGHPEALAKTKYAAPRWELLKTCFAREMLLISRHRFLYIFKTCQVAFVGFVTCTIFNRSRLHPGSEIEGNLYLSCLFFGLVHMLFNGFSELSLLMFRLPVFYKQRDNLFHPAWAWSLASFLLRVPYSILEAVIWSLVVYYSVGFSPEIWRFFRFMFLLFSVHQMALGVFRLVAAVARDMVIANTFASACLLITFLSGGFIIPKAMIKPWWSWAFWISPLTYAQRAISVNEFAADRWMKKSATGNDTIGANVLRSHSLPTDEDWYWLGVGVLLLYALIFNILVTLALAFLHPLKKAQAVAPSDAAEKMNIKGYLKLK
ncbi:ABC transporter G family member 31 [Linum grandiflorum]